MLWLINLENIFFGVCTMFKYTDNDIRNAAYYIWQNNGCPANTQAQDWAAAINQLNAMSTLKSASKKLASSRTVAAKKSATKAAGLKSASLKTIILKPSSALKSSTKKSSSKKSK